MNEQTTKVGNGGKDIPPSGYGKATQLEYQRLEWPHQAEEGETPQQ